MNLLICTVHILLCDTTIARYQIASIFKADFVVSLCHQYLCRRARGPVIAPQLAPANEQIPCPPVALSVLQMAGSSSFR